MRKVRKEYLFFVLFVDPLNSTRVLNRRLPFFGLFSLFFFCPLFFRSFFFFDLFFIHHRVSIRPSSLFFCFFFLLFFCFFERFLTRFFPSLLFVFFLSPEKKLKKVFVVVVGT